MSEHPPATTAEVAPAPTPPPAELLRWAMIGLVAGLVLCLGGIIGLTAFDKLVPDVLAVTAGAVVGAISTLLVNPGGPGRHRA